MTNQEYCSLKSELNKHSCLYYNDSNPIISDEEYDKKFNQLLEYERNNPDAYIADSPSQRIGADPVSEFEKIKHSKKMMSIEKVYSVKELDSFSKKSKLVSDEYSVEYKIDGLAISLIYENSILTKALTRGNGVVGENVIENVKVINGVPLSIPKSMNPTVEIRGEVYMSFKVFEELNKNKKLNGEQLLANPRNAAAGALKRRDSKISKQSKLSMIAYDVVDPLQHGLTNQFQVLSTIKDLGFKTPEYEIVNGSDNLKSVIDKFGNNKNNLPYPVDGVVVKINDIASRSKFKDTSSHPKWLVAYKYAEEIEETKVLNIDIQVGKSGALTPVAILEPVEICGSIVSKASLHNFDQVEKLDIRVGDIVGVKKAGEIIPQILYVNMDNRIGKNLEKFKRPELCPVCCFDVANDNDNVALICQNPDCLGKIVGKVLYWASKDVMNIDGLGDAIVEKMYDANMIHNIIDLYDITPDDICRLDGMAEKSSKNIYNSIQKSKEMPFEKVLAGLQIPNTGKTTSSLLANTFKDIQTLRSQKVEDLKAIDGIGDVVANSIYNWFREYKNEKLVMDLVSYGFNMKVDESETMNTPTKSDAFAGEMVCVTGVLFTPRAHIHELILENGGKIDKSVTSKTTLLVVGENAGSKLAKAASKGITIISEDEFLERIGKG